jgi:hypothetical protein
MVKITTTKGNRAGLTVQLHGISVSFDAKCEAEVTEEEAAILKGKDPSILLEGEEPAEEIVEEAKWDGKGIPTPAQAEALIAERKAAEEAPEEPVEEAPEEEAEEAPADDIEAPAEEDEGTAMKLTVPELHAICREADLPSKEWKSLKKADLIAYIESHT